MHDELNELEQNKPLEETSFLDSCKAAPMQRFWKEMKDASLEVLKDRIGDDELAEMAFNAMKNCKEGYMIIRRNGPSLGEPHEGWTYVFAEGLPLYLDNPDEWYHTSNIQKIDWEGHTFATMNSVYTFEFIDRHINAKINQYFTS